MNTVRLKICPSVGTWVVDGWRMGGGWVDMGGGWVDMGGSWVDMGGRCVVGCGPRFALVLPSFCPRCALVVLVLFLCCSRFAMVGRRLADGWQMGGR